MSGDERRMREKGEVSKEEGGRQRGKGAGVQYDARRQRETWGLQNPGGASSGESARTDKLFPKGNIPFSTDMHHRKKENGTQLFLI